MDFQRCSRSERIIIINDVINNFGNVCTFSQASLKFEFYKLASIRQENGIIEAAFLQFDQYFPPLLPSSQFSLFCSCRSNSSNLLILPFLFPTTSLPFPSQPYPTLPFHHSLFFTFFFFSYSSLPSLILRFLIVRFSYSLILFFYSSLSLFFPFLILLFSYSFPPFFFIVPRIPPSLLFLPFALPSQHFFLLPYNLPYPPFALHCPPTPFLTPSNSYAPFSRYFFTQSHMN